MANKYSTILNRPIPQTQPVPEKNMVRNDAGGYAFSADKWQMLRRFLVLGSEGGTYYVSERELTTRNIRSLDACLAEDGVRVVETIRDISVSGASLRQSACIFALARAFLLGDLDTRHAVESVANEVLRTASQYFEFVGVLRAEKKPFGRILRRINQRWYDRDSKSLAYQMIKYRERSGFSHRDVLRLAHPDPVDSDHNLLFKHAVGKWSDDTFGEALAQVEAYERAKTAPLATLVKLISESRLPREAVPNTMLNERLVWEALLEDMPMTALVRNLAKMTQVGLISPLSDGRRRIIDALGNGDAIRKARIHPLAILLALRTYQQGKGERGNLTWTPDQQIIEALNTAFYLAFVNVPVSDKRVLVAIDISSSMSADVSGTSMSASEAAAALALVYMKQYRNCELLAFNTSIVHPLGITPSMRLDDVFGRIRRITMGGTSVELPIAFLLQRNLKVDGLITITDSESWAGKRHVFQALDEYRKRVYSALRAVNVQTTASGTQLNDPGDELTMEVIGFGADVPMMTDGFVSGMF